MPSFTKIFVLALLLFSLTLFALAQNDSKATKQSAPSQVTEFYSDQLKRTYMEIKMIAIDRKGEKRFVKMIANYLGKTYVKPEYLALVIETVRPIRTEDTMGIREQLVIFADGVQLDSYTVVVAPAKISADTSGIMSMFPVEHLPKLAAAKSIRITLAGIEITLDEKEAKTIKELSDRLK